MHGLRTRVEANWAAQAKLRGEIARLGQGPLKSAAEKRMVVLQTNMMALNVEMRVRVQQGAGHA